MIQISDKFSLKTVYFPQNLPLSTEYYTLDLIDKVTNKIIRFSGIEDMLLTDYYYTFNMDFSTIQEGEYEYILYASLPGEFAPLEFNDDYNKFIVLTDIASRGLIQIGELTRNIETKIYNPTFNGTRL